MAPSTYYAAKVRPLSARAGEHVGRDQVARLMRSAGIEGLGKSKKRRTTKPDPAACRHPDLVERKFSADRPNQLRVSDLTYVANLL